MHGVGLQGHHHLGVGRIATRGNDGVRGVDLDEVALVIADAALHALLIVDELDKLAVVENRVALLGGLLHEEVVAHRIRIGRLPIVLHNGQVVVGAARGMVTRHVDNAFLARSVHVAADPVDGVGGVVDEHLDKVAVGLTGGVTANLVEKLASVDGLGALGVLGVDAAEVLAGLGHAGGALNRDAVEAQLGGGGGSGRTGATRTDDEDIAVVGGRDVGSIHLGLSAKPCRGGVSDGDTGVSKGTLNRHGSGGRALDSSGLIGQGDAGDGTRGGDARQTQGRTSDKRTTIHGWFPFSCAW